MLLKIGYIDTRYRLTLFYVFTMLTVVVFSPLEDEAESDAEGQETEDGTAFPDNLVNSDDEADEYILTVTCHDQVG